MESIIVAPSDFIQKLKDSLIPEITKEITKQIGGKIPTEYLTTAEVSKLLKVDRSTLWRWQKEGKLPSYGIGNRVYFIREEVDQILLNNKLK